jgi:hypothetical protein
MLINNKDNPDSKGPPRPHQRPTREDPAQAINFRAFYSIFNFQVNT